MKTQFTFQSDGETLVGNLFLPDRGSPVGAVIAVGPLTSVKEQAAGTYAAAMAGRGYAALAFDYRTDVPQTLDFIDFVVQMVEAGQFD